MKRFLPALLLAALSLGLVSPAPAKEAEVKLRPIAREKYTGGSHLDFGNGYAYGGEINGVTGRDEEGYEDKGGIHVFDITGKPRETGFFKCPGNDLDVAYVKPGVVAVGFHKAACVGPGEGIFTLDVSNPRKPKMLGAHVFESQLHRTHAIARYPGKPLIYSAGGGLGARQETVAFVDVSNPRKPKLAGSFLAPPRGCHDFTFHFDKRGKFGFCAGLGEVQIWDVSKPLAPEVIARIHEPLDQFAHYALASPNGKLLAVNDEAITVNECTDQPVPAGAVWIYDISDITNPQLLSYFSPPRGNTGSPLGSFWTPGGTCTSHDFNWANNTTLVMPWYTGGFSLIDVSDPAAPSELAYYQAKGTNTWSAYWYKGRIYTNDMGRGFETLIAEGL